MPTKNVREIRSQRQPIFWVFGFYCLYSAEDPRPLNLDSQTFPVEVFPTQPKQFTCSKPERCVHHGHCPSIFIEMRPETLKFLNRQSARLFYSLCESFEFHQTHRIAVVLRKFPAHCPLEQNMHHASNMALSLWC